MKFRDKYGDPTLLSVALIAMGAFAVIIAIIVIFVNLIIIYVDPVKCEARWGERAKFEYWAGCLVETNKGYLPERAVTAVDIGAVLK